MNFTIESEKNNQTNSETEGLSNLNEAISNIGGITSSLDEIEILKSENCNKQKLSTNLSYNFNYFRNLIIVLDMTEKMNMNDIKPTRQKFLYKKIENFITNYFKYNYISTITIITMRDYIATITSVSSNDPAIIIENLKKEEEPQGFPSISNALTVCAEYLILLDKLNNFNNEIVFFYSSPNSFDRNNVYSLLENFVESKIEIHFFTFENPFELLYVNKINLICLDNYEEYRRSTIQV